MNTNPTAGTIPVVAMFDYLQPGINRPDLFNQRAYPMTGGGGGGSSLKSLQKNNTYGERSPYITLYYTIGLIVVSALIFITIAAWFNLLMSWLDSIYINSVIEIVTRSRLYYAIIVTIISFVTILILLLIWYYFTVKQNI